MRNATRRGNETTGDSPIAGWPSLPRGAFDGATNTANASAAQPPSAGGPYPLVTGAALVILGIFAGLCRRR